jgi:D-alanyl-D-alanine carboxypeptidase
VRSVCAGLGISAQFLAARGLCEFHEPSGLELVEVGADGREHWLTPEASSAWREMKAAALADGVELIMVSAFRSIERQAEIIRNKLALGALIDDILELCAPPGFSEHHSGRALDLTCPQGPVLEVEFAQTPAFAWLSAHAGSFGYALSYPPGNRFGYQYEPWHWCYCEGDT